MCSASLTVASGANQILTALANRLEVHSAGMSDISQNLASDRKPLRIALTCDPELPVPPRLYGGIERIIDMLAKGLETRGHSVTLFAHPQSATAGRLVAWPGSSSRSPMDTMRNAATLTREVATGHFDLVHSFSRIAYMTPILPWSIPKLMSYSRAISRGTASWGHRLSAGTLEFTAMSHWMMRGAEQTGRWSLVPNGVCLDTYDARPHVAPDAPLVFLGRLEEIKGPHLAVEIARRAGMPLIIAGNIADEHYDWFEAHVAPHIDNRHVHYIGQVDDGAKNRLLGSARALLMPILWDEPFGMVLIEAMACGTPVLGFGRGAVPEVVEDGVTGFVREDPDGLVEACRRINGIDRTACRARVERLYSEDAILTAYLRLYDRMLARSGRPSGA
jgi:glycosyltransferase involved in cell wall biosynthesis